MGVVANIPPVSQFFVAALNAHEGHIHAYFPGLLAHKKP